MQYTLSHACFARCTIHDLVVHDLGFHIGVCISHINATVLAEK